MNTKNILCSPFVHVLLMAVFLLFSLGCPASRPPVSGEKKEVGESPKASASAPAPVVITPEKPTTSALGKIQEKAPIEKVSATEPPPTSEKSKQPVIEPPKLPSLVEKPSESVSVQRGEVEITQVSGSENRTNPLRQPGESGSDLPAPPLESSQGNGQIHDLSQPRIQKTTPNAPENKSSLAPPTKQKLPASPKEYRPPLDLIKENGEYFTNWTKPEVALLITGKIEGYLEPCGCAGIERMKGGMARRYSLFNQLREKGWPVVGLDVGGLAHGFGRQSEIKFHTLVDGMKLMRYDAIALGDSDLKLPAGELVADTADSQNQKSPFVSANVGLFGFESAMIAKTRIIAAGGKKIGVTAVLGKSFIKEIHNPEIEFDDPVKAIQKVLPELKNADLLVLLAHASKEESITLAKKFPQFNIVVTAGGQPAPPDDWEKIEGAKPIFVEVGYKGMYAVVLGFYDKPTKVLYQRVALDSRESFIDKNKQAIVSTTPSSPEMKNLMDAYQDQLKTIGFEGLGLRAAPHPLKEAGGRFVGTDKCRSCHEESDKVWKRSPHSKAYETLAKLDPPRNNDPECVSCHVVGWNPQRFFPYESGYHNKEKTPHLLDVGCEDCHGPGEFHCKAEEGGDQAKMDKYRKVAVITKAESEKNQCRTCHDGDNSPDFNFEKYWPFVEHYENKDK